MKRGYAPLKHPVYIGLQKGGRDFREGFRPSLTYTPPSLIKGRGSGRRLFEGIGHRIKIQSESLFNSLLTKTIDKPIFVMVDYSIMKLMCIKMFNASHGAERNAFVFTVRTEVRLGGL